MKAFVNNTSGAIERLVNDGEEAFEPARADCRIEDWPEGTDPIGLYWPQGESGPIDDIAAQLADAKRDAQAQVAMLRDQHSYGGMTITGIGIIQTDEKSLTKIVGQAQRAQLLGAAFSDSWRMEDNSLVPVNADTMIQIGLAVGQFISDCQARKNALDTAIDAATTLAELEAIDITSGWPS